MLLKTDVLMVEPSIVLNLQKVIGEIDVQRLRDAGGMQRT